MVRLLNDSHGSGNSNINETTAAGKLATKSEAKTRRVFGIPGASLMSAHSLGENERTAGIDGENRVAAELERLAAQYSNMYVFHSVKLPHHEGDIDHIVVQGDVILLVDSKNWKNDATYRAADPELILRDEEVFSGSHISLTRQVYDWASLFALSQGRVKAVLVIANRKSRIIPSRIPYSFVNLDDLGKAFDKVFTKQLVAPMPWKLLQFFLTMLQTPDGMSFARRPTKLPKFYSYQRTVRFTKLLVAWSVLNLFIGLFPVCFLTIVPLLIVGHIHQAKLKRLKLKGTGWMKTVLISSYVILGLWALIIGFLMVQGVF